MRFLRLSIQLGQSREIGLELGHDVVFGSCVAGWKFHRIGPHELIDNRFCQRLELFLGDPHRKAGPGVNYQTAFRLQGSVKLRQSQERSFYRGYSAASCDAHGDDDDGALSADSD